MKRAFDLFDRIRSPEALLAAFYRARRGKRYRLEADSFFANLEKEVFALSRALSDGTYTPGEYRHFYVQEPKLRLVSAAPFRDRVVHHAIHAVLEPIFEKRFIFDTYACRSGKGQHRALDRFTRYARRFPWVMKLDVRKYFPSIDHGHMLGLVRGAVADERLLAVIARIVTSGAGIHPESLVPDWFPGDTLWTPAERPRGLPIGNLTSQLFANVYLAPLDQFVKRELRCRAYLRYMDDLVFFGRERAELAGWREAVTTFLERWRLRVHPDKCYLARCEQGTAYLGFRVFPDHRLLLGRGVRRYGRRLGQMRRDYGADVIGVPRVRQSVQSWIGHVKHGDTWALRRSMLEGSAFVRGEAAVDG